MAKEIERKFLVTGHDYKTHADVSLIRQGFLSSVKERVVRVRVTGNKGFLTIKGLTVGAVRKEFEYEIPVAEANEMLNELCENPIIEKHRYIINFKGFTWEVDEFHGANDGLVVAEIELANEDQKFPKPHWVGKEVTDDPRYFNVNLIAHPYSKW